MRTHAEIRPVFAELAEKIAQNAKRGGKKCPFRVDAEKIDRLSEKTCKFGEKHV